MSSNIQLFYYENTPARVIMLNGQPWWVAKDVCDILGYSNSRKALADHLEEDEKGVTIKCIPQITGKGQVLLVNLFLNNLKGGDE